MNLKRRAITVTARVGNEERQIILSPEPLTSCNYNIMIDRKYLGQVIKQFGGWKVHAHDGSWLKDESCEAIRKAVLNAENATS